MSVAAPKLEPGSTRERARPARRPAARPRASLPSPSQRARRGSHSAFWILTAVIVTVLVVGIVSFSALLVRASFQVDAIRESLAGLQAEHEELATEVVTLSAPSRIADWAKDRGMMHAADVTVLRVRAGSTT